MNNVEIAFNQFVDIMNDDLNTPKALSFMWEILREEKLNDSEKFKSQTRNRLRPILNATVNPLIIAGIFVLWAA